MAPVVAAIDCGTNSIRLLVARNDEGDLYDLDRRMVTVRLGEGVDRTGMLSQAALDRAFTACAEYGRIADSFGVEALRFVATSASRDAGNASAFQDGVRRILGVAPEVITGAEEAELSFRGATAGLAFETPALVFDIGGGSTEFVIGDDRPRQSISVDMGCVRFTERLAHRDPMSADQMAAVRAAVDLLMDRVTAELDVGSAASVIGLAGTVTTVVAIALGLPHYDAVRIQGARVTADRVHEVAQSLATATTAQRASLPVMHHGRADVVHVGALILSQILIRVDADHLIASEHDILDGIAWSLLDLDRV